MSISAAGHEMSSTSRSSSLIFQSLLVMIMAMPDGLRNATGMAEAAGTLIVPRAFSLGSATPSA